MLFNSLEFIAFLTVIYVCYRLISFRKQNYMLLAASYFFYGWWDWRFVFLMALSTAVDFWVGLTMDRGRLTLRERLISSGFLILSAMLFLGTVPKNLLAPETRHAFIANQAMGLAVTGTLIFCAIAYGLYCFLIKASEENRRKACLIISISTQLTILGIFKYFNFFIDSFDLIAKELNFSTSNIHLNVILPVGLSFYTFQSMSYAIDIYRRELKPTQRFFDFALFVAFFPQLVAGPINRARHLIPQLSRPRVLTIDETTRGLYLIVLGLFKKVAIADGVAPAVDQIFGSNGAISWADVVVGTVLFAVQIYTDFSGYSDVARGVAKLFGVDLMVNFNQPYFSRNPREFWQRWHISLSTWLGDYLYKPLGGNRGTLAFTSRNLMITMVLGGLWHGAAWNYVLWGFYQGSLLCAHRLWTHSRRNIAARLEGPLANIVFIGIFFVLTCYGWLLFRAHSLEQVSNFSSILFTDFGNLDYGGAMPRPSAIIGVILLGAMELVQHLRGESHWYQRLPLPLLGLLISTMIYITLMGTSNEPAQFIYFQF